MISYFLPYYAAVMVTLYWATGGLIQPVLTDVSHVLTMPAALRRDRYRIAEAARP